MTAARFAAVISVDGDRHVVAGRQRADANENFSSAEIQHVDTR
jgi:hypothetical protein